MPRASGLAIDETPLSGRVHIIGAGPVGLLLTALLQPAEGVSVHLYEKRPDYTRTRMVQLASYLVAGSIESYCTDSIDGESISAIFAPLELAEGLAFRQSIPADLMALLRSWAVGFCPLNDIERALSELIDARRPHPVQRTAGAVTVQEVMTMLAPDDIVIDCTGARSLLRDQLVPGAVEGSGAVDANTFKVRLEHALVITFLYGQPYDCNEYCKYYKNIDSPRYKFIPAVNRTCYDGSVSHVTGIVNITVDDFQAMPSHFDGQWLRTHFPHVAQAMDRFIAKVKQETNGNVIGDLEIVRIPMDLYHARNATSREWHRAGGDHPFARSPVFLAGDSAMGSPYFQSISLGFECAMFLAGLLGQRDLPLREAFDRYELYTYKQWLRVYMRSKMIKHNKDLFEVIGDSDAMLEKLHIY